MDRAHVDGEQLTQAIYIYYICRNLSVMGFRSSRFHHQHGSSSTSSERKGYIQIKHYVVLGFLEVGPISLTMATVKMCVLCIDELHSVLPRVIREKVSAANLGLALTLSGHLDDKHKEATARAGKWDVAGRTKYRERYIARGPTFARNRQNSMRDCNFFVAPDFFFANWQRVKYGYCLRPLAFWRLPKAVPKITFRTMS